MGFSSIPLLIAVILAFLGGIAWRARRRGYLDGRQLAAWLGLLVCLAAWGAVSARLAASGAYLGEHFLRALPGLWLPLVPMAIAGVLAAALPPLRSGARRLADSTPLLWFTWLQALRIAALGTLVKTAAGTFPPHFGLLVGVPDFLFGLSALAVARLQRDGRISPRRVGLWHALGCAVVALPAGPLIQAGLPGPLEVFRGSEALLVYPMALAPTLVVPLLVMVNAWIAFHLLVARGREPSV